MPYGNRTGPFGEGPMTGRGLGHCSGYDSPGYVKGNFGCRFGRGLRRGRGFGRGRRFRNWTRIELPTFGRTSVRNSTLRNSNLNRSNLDSNEEINLLEQHINVIEDEKRLLEQDLDAIKKRLNELKNNK